jgi:hypothetical protein
VTRGIRDADGRCKACGWPVDQHSRPQLNGCRLCWRRFQAEQPQYQAPRRRA